MATLSELKLASGMTCRGRLKDIGDVVELIKSLTLAESLVEQFNPFVRDKYRELWRGAQIVDEIG